MKTEEDNVSFQLESLDVRCEGGLEGPEGRLLEVFDDTSTKLL